MALSLRLRRAIPLTSSVINHHKALSSIVSFPEPPPSLSSPILAPQNPNHNIPFQSRGFRSSSTLLSSRSPRTSSNFDSETIGPDDILFEGCDYNHWLITMDFPKDPRPSAEEMVETYVQTATAVLGSREEAMKNIYACSTTTYQGFQVQVSEEVSEKFKAVPGVVFVLPDSYIDPVNKEYGGDKYDNGVITHRPPPVLHLRQGRYGDRNRENRDYNRPPGPGGPMQQQPPWQQQNYQNSPQSPMQQGPPPQQNYQNPPRDSMQQGSPPQQNYQNPPRGPMQQGPQQNYQNPPRGPMQHGPPPQQNYQNPPRGPMQQGPQQQQNYQNPRMNNVPEGQGNYQVDRRGPVPPYQGNYNQGERRDFYPPGQRDFQPLDRMNNAPSVPPVGISGKGWGGNPGQGVEGNYGQRSGENYRQETTSNHRQGGSRTSEPGLGGAHGRDVGSGSSHGSTGYGENPSFQQVEQRDFMQGLHENQTNNWGSTSKP